MLRSTFRRSISTSRSLLSSYNSTIKPILAEDGLAGAIGNTPLIKLRSVSKELGRNIYAKAEFMNPGGSVKDRPALYIVEEAERRGLLQPGGTIVEGTAGNTGISLAHLARSRGYKCIAYMPDTLVKSKVEIMQMLGAEVFAVPVVPVTDPMNFNQQAKRHAESLDNAIWANQFDNLANRQSHIETTGPEIWKQLEGKVDAFACGLGSGGTWGGNTRFLKEKNPNLKSYVAEPPGSVVVSYVESGLKTFVKEGNSFIEGVGQQGRINSNVMKDIELADGAFLIPDQESIIMLFRLIDEEGLYLGGSSALNVIAACRAAALLPENSNVVTILPDSAHKYTGRFFSKTWLKSVDMWEGIPDGLKKYAALD